MSNAGWHIHLRDFLSLELCSGYWRKSVFQIHLDELANSTNITLCWHSLRHCFLFCFCIQIDSLQNLKTGCSMQVFSGLNLLSKLAIKIIKWDWKTDSFRPKKMWCFWTLPMTRYKLSTFPVSHDLRRPQHHGCSPGECRWIQPPWWGSSVADCVNYICYE